MKEKIQRGNTKIWDELYTFECRLFAIIFYINDILKLSKLYNEMT